MQKNKRLLQAVYPGPKSRVCAFLTNHFYIMQKKITAHNYAHKGFEFTQPSVTVPGQVHSIKQILERFRRGQGVQSFPGVYNPEVPPGYETMDKIERIEAAREQAAKVSRMRADLLRKEANEKAAKQAVKEADIVAEKAATEQ